MPEKERDAGVVLLRQTNLGDLVRARVLTGVDELVDLLLPLDLVEDILVLYALASFTGLQRRRAPFQLLLFASGELARAVLLEELLQSLPTHGHRHGPRLVAIGPKLGPVSA